ncbi:MAG: translation initiation factor IF-3 [unclassified Hahellaceae]|nr:translation initiation factor IF-3 [Hahellaceae bacterium]
MNGEYTIKRTQAGSGKERPKINQNIVATQVRLISSSGEQMGIVSLQEALTAAEAESLDLVQMSEGDPIVGKIMDYGKKIFDEKKQKAASKKKQKQQQVKEMKFRPGTEEGDYQVKLRNLMRFLEQGDKAKVSIRFRGREMAHQELGIHLLERIEKDLAEIGTVESRPKVEGRQAIMVIAPKKKK